MKPSCIFDGCVSTERHWHGGFPGGYENPADPHGPPIAFTDEPAPGVRDYNGNVLTPDDLAAIRADIASSPIGHERALLAEVDRLTEAERWGCRRVWCSVELFDSWGTRTEDGARLSVAWGEPDADGNWTPTITRHDDDNILAAERARIRAAVEGLYADAGRDMGADPDETVLLGLAAVLRVIDGGEG